MRHHVRHKKIIHSATQFCILLSLSSCHLGCVSVKLGNENVSKSSSVEYKKPNAPFESISLKNADQAWQNKSTGTTLSYLSLCNDTNDPTLESLRDSTLRGLEGIQIGKEEIITFNKREGLKSDVTGQLDGVKVAVRLLIFKKNFCSYTISMVGIQGKFNSDSPQFDSFLEGFVAP